MTIAEIIASACAVLAIIVSIALPMLLARDANAKSKGKQEATEEAAKKTFDAISKDAEGFELRIKALEISTAVDRSAINTVGASITGLRAEMDRRFDQLERMISGSGLHRKRDREE